MKKLSLLMALFMCLTIGGVYAAWTYSGTNDIADVLYEAKVTIADTEIKDANGIYKIESNLVLLVDQKAGTDHVAELKFESNNSNPIYVKVTFTPSDGAPREVKQGAVKSELYFTTTTAMQYRVDANGNYSQTAAPKDIFWFSNPSNGEIKDTDPTITWTKFDENDNDITSNATAYGKYFTYELNETQLRDMIKLNDENGTNPFILDTKEEHDIFGGIKEVNGVKEGLIGNIVIKVTDGTVN